MYLLPHQNLPTPGLQIPLARFWAMSGSLWGLRGVGGAEKLHSHRTVLLVLHGMLWSLVGSAVVLEGCCTPGGDAVVPGGMLSPREGDSGPGWGKGVCGEDAESWGSC